MAGRYDTLTISSSSSTSLTNVAHGDILRLTAPESGHLGEPSMDTFDHDLHFEGEGLLYLFPYAPLLALLFKVRSLWNDC